MDLAGVEDDQVFDYAVSEDRIVVTENFGDYARIMDQRLIGMANSCLARHLL